MTTDRKSKCCGVKLTIFTDVEEGASWYLCSKCNEACDVTGGKWRFNLGKLNQNYVRTGDQPMPEEEKLTTNKMMQLVQSNCCGALIGIYEHPICTQCNKKCEISHEELQFKPEAQSDVLENFKIKDQTLWVKLPHLKALELLMNNSETETLRDRFASNTLSGMQIISTATDEEIKIKAIAAYAYADAMLKARKQK